MRAAAGGGCIVILRDECRDGFGEFLGESGPVRRRPEANLGIDRQRRQALARLFRAANQIVHLADNPCAQGDEITRGHVRSARPTCVPGPTAPARAFPGDSSSVTQYLEPGSYVWICPVEDNGGTPHFSKGEFKPFVVQALDGVVADRTAGPEASLVVRLLDLSFALDSLVPAGRHTIRVENAGVEPHDLVLMKLAPGKTVADMMAGLNPERARRAGQAGEPPPPLESLGTGAGGIAAIAPGKESFFETTLSPGAYVLLCMATAPDGRSHIEHGMVKQFRIH